MRKNNTPSLPVPTEADEQIALFEWAALQSGRFPELTLLHHVPNGGSRNKIEAARLRAQGVKSGVPDLCLPVARGGNHGLYIELKRQRGGRILSLIHILPFRANRDKTHSYSFTGFCVGWIVPSICNSTRLSVKINV